MIASAAGEDEIAPYPHCILITLSQKVKLRLREESATDEAVNKNLDLSNELIKVELPS